MSALFVESASELPLAWFTIMFPGGSSSDPEGREGLATHAAQLARRGAGDRDRQQLDRAVDDLGASLSMNASVDATSLSGMCLSRNLPALIELASDVLARPHLAESEHEKLRRETLNDIDDLRDDDSWLATRYFTRYCVPGYPYARTSLGTADTLADIDADAARGALEDIVCPDAALIGFAGDVTELTARSLADRALAEIPERPTSPYPALPPTERPRGRRLYLIDKPNRTQSQLMLGHLGPRFGSDGWLHLYPVETAFGGMFSSRLMQEIRVRRGWSYGAGCRVGVARDPHWFRMSLAPAAEVTPDALALTLSLFDDLCDGGITEDELTFAVRYLSGAVPMSRATARQRMRQALRHRLFGMPDSFTESLPDRLATVGLEDTRQAISDWLHPADLCIVMVATASTMMPALKDAGVLDTIDHVEVVAYDEY